MTLLAWTLVFIVLLVAFVSAYGLGPLLWKGLTGSDAGRQYRDMGLVSGLAIGGLITTLAYGVSTRMIRPDAPDIAANFYMGRVYRWVLPFCLTGTFLGAQVGIGLNIGLRPQLRRGLLTRLSALRNTDSNQTAADPLDNPSGRPSTPSVKAIRSILPTLVWSGLASLCWGIWYWRLFQFPGRLWTMDASGENRLGLITLAAAVCGAVFALLWQRVYQQPLLTISPGSLRSPRPYLISMMVCAVVGAGAWWLLFEVFSFWLRVRLEGALQLVLQSQPVYLALHIGLLSLTTGPLLGFLLRLKRRAIAQQLGLGAAWGVIVLTGYTLMTGKFGQIYLASPFPDGLHLLSVILMQGGILGVIIWCCRNRLRTAWGLSLTVMALVATAGVSLAILVWLSSLIGLELAVQRWLDPLHIRNARDGLSLPLVAWAFVRQLPLLPPRIVWGALLGALVVLVGKQLPAYPLAPLSEAYATTASAETPAPRVFYSLGEIGQMFLSLVHKLWPRYPRLWTWMGLWSAGWLSMMLALRVWQQPLLLWPNRLLFTFTVRSGREVVSTPSLLGILETIAIATLFGAIVGMGWQYTRQQSLWAGPLGESDWSGVTATAICGGALGSGWLTLFLVAQTAGWFRSSANPEWVWLAMPLYLVLHALLLGWATTLLGHAFRLEQGDRLFNFVLKSAILMALVCGLWALLQHQYQIYDIWIAKAGKLYPDQAWRRFGFGLKSIIAQLLGGGLVGAGVGGLGYAACRSLPEIPQPNTPESNSSGASASASRARSTSPTVSRPSSSANRVSRQQPLSTQALMRQARAGEPEALAQRLNRQLQSQNIQARVYRRGSQLQIILSATTAPAQAAGVQFVRRGLRRLRPNGIRQVRLIGKQDGEQTAVWQTQFDMELNEP